MSKQLELHMWPSGSARIRTVFGWAALLIFLHFIAAPVEALAQNQVFYAIGFDDQTKDRRLYQLDAATLTVVRSLDLSKAASTSEITSMSSGMLTGKRDAVILSDGGIGVSTLMRVSVPDLVLRAAAKIKSHKIDCLQHTFVHPLTGLAYFSCDEGSSTEGGAVVDPFKGVLVTDLLPEPKAGTGVGGINSPQFAYDPNRQRLYMAGDDVAALDPANHIVGYVRAQDAAKAAGFDVSTHYDPRLKANVHSAWYSIESIAIVPNGNLVLFLKSNSTPNLLLYDPTSRKVLHRWTETQKYTEKETFTDRSTGKQMERAVQRIARLHHGPVSSKDGSRLFAISGKEGVMFDSSTLELLDRWTLPEEPGGPAGRGGSCFFPAPDGNGIWYLGNSGKVYRLDDHTGRLLEQVKLPFHLTDLIREP